MLMLSQHLKDFLEQSNRLGQPLVVALSGGVDSVALLLATVELKKLLPQLNVSAIHVNHGLSPNAKDWQMFCDELCAQHQMPFKAYSVTIDQSGKQSLEHMARIARYKVIAENTASSSIVLTGHHSADQAETFLIRLMRSAGLTGLASMRSVSSFPEATGRVKKIELVRPFLGLQKQQLIDYVEAYNTTWVEDESNVSLSFDRNYLRQQVLPLLAQKWPGYSKAISHSVSLLQDEADLLNTYVKVDYMNCLQSGFAQQKTLNIETLTTLHTTKIRAVIRMFCFEQTQQYPSQNVLMEVIASLITAKQDQQPVVSFAEFSFQRHRNLLYISRARLNAIEINGPDIRSLANQDRTTAAPLDKVNQQFELAANTEYTLQHNCFSSLTIESNEVERFVVRFGVRSGKLKMANQLGSKNVKQAFKDMGCPPWLRDDIPLVFHQEALVAIGSRYVHADWVGRLNVVIV